MAASTHSSSPIQIRRSAERGHADHGWLDAHHTFSFASYQDPAHMGFGVLRVLNQDRVQPMRGFATHGHDNMEIVTYVLEGELAHEDSMGNGSVIVPGEVQLMSAGTGVTHSEKNPSPAGGVHLLQMWVEPAARDTKPRYEQSEFPESTRRGQLRLVVSPDGADGSLSIGQDARLYAGLFVAGETAAVELGHGRAGWLHVARGSVRVHGELLEAGDGAAISGGSSIAIEGVERESSGQADVVLWDLPQPS